MCVGLQVHMSWCMWRSENNSEKSVLSPPHLYGLQGSNSDLYSKWLYCWANSPSVALHCIFLERASTTDPGAYQFSEVSWPVSSRNSSVSIPALGFQKHHSCLLSVCWDWTQDLGFARQALYLVISPVSKNPFCLVKSALWLFVAVVRSYTFQANTLLLSYTL